MDADANYDIYLALFDSPEPFLSKLGCEEVKRLRSMPDYKSNIVKIGLKQKTAKLLFESTNTKIYEIDDNQIVKLYKDPTNMKYDYEGIKIFTELGLPLFAYKKCMIYGSEALIMEKLFALEPSDAIPMLYDMIDLCFRYKDHFCHSDIKLENIMKTKDGRYRMIDLNLSTQKWMYGFKRMSYSYNASQKGSYYNIITIKQEIIELIHAAAELMGHVEDRLDLYGKKKHPLGPVLLVAMNIDERDIKQSDLELLFLAVANKRAIKKVYKYLLIGEKTISNESLLAIVNDK